MTFSCGVAEDVMLLLLEEMDETGQQTNYAALEQRVHLQTALLLQLWMMNLKRCMNETIQGNILERLYLRCFETDDVSIPVVQLSALLRCNIIGAVKTTSWLQHFSTGGQTQSLRMFKAASNLSIGLTNEGRSTIKGSRGKHKCFTKILNRTLTLEKMKGTAVRQHLSHLAV